MAKSQHFQSPWSEERLGRGLRGTDALPIQERERERREQKREAGEEMALRYFDKAQGKIDCN